MTTELEIGAGGASMPLDRGLDSARVALKVGLGLAAFLAGLDKFFNLLADWGAYLSPLASAVLPISAVTFMRVAGVVEMAVGLAILTRWTRIGSYVAAVWLLAIAAKNLAMFGGCCVAFRPSADTPQRRANASDPLQRQPADVRTRPAIGLLTRLALIAVAIAAVAGTFACFGGVRSDALTPARIVDRFEQVDGVHSGFRRNHAKGLGVSGSFESNGNGVRLSKAAVFEPGRVPVIGRFSLDGGQPYQPDRPNTRRGLGLQFSLPNGELWRTAMINFPLFPVRTPEIFYERLLAFKQDPATGESDPSKVKAFEDRHPETVDVLKKITAEPRSSGFGNTTFYGLNTFLLTNAAGVTIPVRWILKPLQPFEAAGAAPPDRNYLFHDLITQVHRQPLRWRLIVIVGTPADPTNDPSIGWPADREQVDVGTLTLDRVEAEEFSAATDIFFDPLMLPSGMAPSDDPVLRVRSPVYSQSHTRRAGETRQPSAITPADVKTGE